ncbi:MAG: Hsp20/alpha crystallin family protein [Patescibacteria group bacterium]|nr:Hsp20/alpha crystallin family protein [Patescibacteria group bacterium]
MGFFKKLKKDIGIVEESKKEAKPLKKIKNEKEKEEKEEEKKEKKEQKKKELKEIPVCQPKKEIKDWLKSEGQLAVDVYEQDEEFCIRAPIAGISPADIDISVENEMLLIKGERKEPEKEKEKNYFYQECYWGNFARQIILPKDVDSQKIKASLNKGILTIKIPKVKTSKKRKITVISEE